MEETRVLLPRDKPSTNQDEVETTLELPTKSDRYNIVVMSVAFLILFLSYNSLQNYVTSLLPGNLGNESMGVLYVSVCLFVFVAPTTVAAWGERIAMIVGAAGYLVFMASLIKIDKAVVLLCSVVIGAGAAILWVAQGAFLVKASAPGTYGANAGMFWGIFQVSNVAGNLAAYFVYQHVGGGRTLFVSFLVVASLGTIVFFLMRPLRPGLVKLKEAEEARPESPREKAVNVLRVMATPVMIALMYIILFSGYELAFWAGQLPLLIPTHSIGAVLTFTGIGEICGSFILAPLSDRIGHSISLVTGGVVYGAGLYCCYLLQAGKVSADAPSLAGAPYVAYIAALVFGMGDSIFNTQIIAVIGQRYSASESVTAITIFQLYQNLGSALGFYLPVFVPLVDTDDLRGSLGQIWLQVVLLSAGAVLFVLVDQGTIGPSKQISHA
eukprot:m.92693 g.92693  ORF g.92693 m.92693 type:complete len:439 (-) comp8657_c1_seq2:43-1359(-)